MRRVFGIVLSIGMVLSLSSCKKESAELPETKDLTTSGFVVTEIATCNNGVVKITKLDVGELYASFEHPTFIPKPNTWYMEKSDRDPKWTYRFKIGSDVSPKQYVVMVMYPAEKDKVLSPQNLCK